MLDMARDEALNFNQRWGLGDTHAFTCVSMLCMGMCISYFPHCYNKISDKSNLGLAHSLNVQFITAGKWWWRQLVTLYLYPGSKE